MAKLRKRFYVAIYINGAREIVSCKFKHDVEIGAFLGLSRIVGPFRTFEKACESIARV